MNPILVDSPENKDPDLWFTDPDGLGPHVFISQTPKGPVLIMIPQSDIIRVAGGSDDFRRLADAMLEAEAVYARMKRKKLRLSWGSQ